MLLAIVACGGSDLRAATEADLDALQPTEANVGPPYVGKTREIDHNVARTVFRAPDDSSRIEIETQVLRDASGAKRVFSEIQDRYKEATLETVGEEALRPTGLTKDALVIHRAKSGDPNCFGGPDAEEFVAVLYRSNVMSLVSVFSESGDNLELVATLGNRFAERIEFVLKD